MRRFQLKAIAPRKQGSSIHGSRQNLFAPLCLCINSWLMGKRVLIVGPGFVGLSLCFELSRQGHQVFGLRRKAPSSSDKVIGITSFQADISRAETLAHL